MMRARPPSSWTKSRQMMASWTMMATRCGWQFGGPPGDGRRRRVGRPSRRGRAARSTAAFLRLNPSRWRPRSRPPGRRSGPARPAGALTSLNCAVDGACPTRRERVLLRVRKSGAVQIPHRSCRRGNRVDVPLTRPGPNARNLRKLCAPSLAGYYWSEPFTAGGAAPGVARVRTGCDIPGRGVPVTPQHDRCVHLCLNFRWRHSGPGTAWCEGAD
jgi:hypothetical protein